MADHAWSGLKPSRARVVEAGRSRPEHTQQHQGSFLRGTEWAPSCATPNAGCEESMSPLRPWGGPAPGTHGPATAPARWNRLVQPDLGRSGAAAGHDVINNNNNNLPGLLLQPAVADHRQGWKRISSPSINTPKLWRTSSTSSTDQQQRHLYRFDSSPCSELKLDEEMTMFESQITRTVSDHFSHLTSLTSSLSQKFSSLAKESDEVIPTPEELAGINPASPAVSKKLSSSEFVGSDQLKRKRSGLPESDFQSDCGWIHPLKLLVRKGLTLSDVGELGRIIIPKKDAESQSFPQIDTKEGTVLEMEDYSASKRWYFRFKFWVNNKSRMYVLENTGEFIKYHSLKENDMFIVYEDGCKNLVVCGQKNSSGNNLDPLLDLSKGSMFESSASETSPTTTEDESSRTTNMDNNIARS